MNKFVVQKAELQIRVLAEQEWCGCCSCPFTDIKVRVELSETGELRVVVESVMDEREPEYLDGDSLLIELQKEE